MKDGSNSHELVPSDGGFIDLSKLSSIAYGGRADTNPCQPANREWLFAKGQPDLSKNTATFRLTPKQDFSQPGIDVTITVDISSGHGLRAGYVCHDELLLAKRALTI